LKQRLQNSFLHQKVCKKFLYIIEIWIWALYETYAMILLFSLLINPISTIIIFFNILLFIHWNRLSYSKKFLISFYFLSCLALLAYFQILMSLSSFFTVLKWDHLAIMNKYVMFNLFYRIPQSTIIYLNLV